MGTTAQRVFSFVVRYKEENDGVAPSYEEIVDACFISKSVVNYHLQQLEKKGFITRPDGRSPRNIQVVGGKWQLTIAK
jgi:DNA-binding MarR family transcriptional regulator